MRRVLALILLLAFCPVCATAQFTVSGGTALTGNASLTVVSGGLAAGWYALSGTVLTSSDCCPGGAGSPGGATGCRAIVDSWSAGGYDAANHVFYLHGGGHNDYYGNQVCHLVLNNPPTSGTLSKVTDPTLPSVNSTAGQASSPQGLPAVLIDFAARAANVATLTCDVTCPFVVGDTLEVQNVSDTTFNVAFSAGVTVASVSGTTLTYANTGSDVSSFAVTARASRYNGTTAAPNTVHTYQGIAFDTLDNKLIRVGGVGANTAGNAALLTAWEFTPGTATWTNRGVPTSIPTILNGGVLLPVPSRSLDYMYDGGSPAKFWEWNRTANTFTQRGGFWPTHAGGRTDWCTAAVDAQNLWALFVCGQQVASASADYQVVKLDGTSFTVHNLAQTGCDNATFPNGMNQKNPGVAWDSKKTGTGTTGKFLGYPNTGSTVYDMAVDYSAFTLTCTAETYSSGPTANASNGMFNRMAYDPTYDVFVLVLTGQANAYVLKRN